MCISVGEGHDLKNDDALRRKQLLAPVSAILGLSGLKGIGRYGELIRIDPLQIEDTGRRSKWRFLK